MLTCTEQLQGFSCLIPVEVLMLNYIRVGKDDWLEKCPLANKDLDWNLAETSLSDIPEAFSAGNHIEWKTVPVSGNILHHRLPSSRFPFYGVCIHCPL